MAVRRVDDGLEAELAPDRRYAPRGDACGHRASYRDTRPACCFRHVPLWGIDVHLVYAPRRVTCEHCGGIHVEALPWVSGKRRFPRALMVTLATWGRVLTRQQVASLFHCVWTTVAAAVEEAVAHGLAHRELPGVTHIGIDEPSRKRGHVYVTNVYDLKRRPLLWSGEGRTKDALETFFDWSGKERTEQLDGVCCDMWQPYVDVVKERAPKAVPVFDRYIWLKNPWNLSDQQQAGVSALEHLNLKLNRAYLLEEAFRPFWSYTYTGWAQRYLDRWFWWATPSRLRPMREFARTLRRHQDDLMNYFRMPIHNGTVEASSNKPKVISHKAFGFRTGKNYIRILYHCLAALPLPKTVHTFA